MRSASIPSDEPARLVALQSLELLDTEPEERFDRITRLAARMFNVPMALLSLVDQDRQWFKSRIGTPELASTRAESFCAHAILGDTPLVIPDLFQDDRFADHPAVHGPQGVRFYAGAPLRWGPGSALGTLCILDRWPRRLAPVDVAMLEDLASLVIREVQSHEQASADEVTGLPSRAGFVLAGQQALDLCRRLSAPAVLCGFRLQGLTSANGTMAAPVADHIRRDFAALLRSSFRTSDTLARIGADTFAVLATQTTEHDLQNALDRLQQAALPLRAPSSDARDLLYRTALVSNEQGAPERIENLLLRMNALLSESP
jgi:diguanylate cyclase (GGDEF)-like protein